MNEIDVKSFMDGKIIALEEVPDPMFSQKMLGDGFAIVPSSDRVLSPIDGVIKTIFPTGHALGIEHKSGLEVLIHLGIDTVEHEGRGFETVVNPGDIVKAGDLICKMDVNYFIAEGVETSSMLIFTTGQNINLLKSNQKVKANEGQILEFK